MLINGIKKENITINVSNYELIKTTKELIEKLYNPKGYYDKDKKEWGYYKEEDDWGGYNEHPSSWWVTLETDEDKIRELLHKRDNYKRFMEIYDFVVKNG